MKTTTELLPKGKWLVTMEASTREVFRMQPFDLLPGTVIRSEGRARTLEKAMQKAQREFEKDAQHALGYYESLKESA